MFLTLAAAGKADFLVTGDQDLLVRGPEFKRPIVTVDAFFKQLGL